MSALSRVVRTQRLSTAEGGDKHRFSVSRVEAVLAVRARPREPWDFTLPLVRSAAAMSAHAWVSVSMAEVDDHDVVVFDLGVPGAPLEDLSVSGLLLAGLEQDAGGVADDPGATQASWRRLMGAAINAALAGEPQWIDLTTPRGGRRWVRSATSAARDPYAEQPVGEAGPEDQLRVRIARRRGGVSENIRSFFVGRGDPLEDLWTLWRARLVFDVDPQEGVVALERSGAGSLPLGDRGRWTPGGEGAGLWLVRQGVRMVELGDVLGAIGVPAGTLRGWVEYSELSLDVDERSVVEDDAFADLSAWLADVVRSGLHEVEAPAWPQEVEAVSTSAGTTLRLETLEPPQGAELLYVWRTASRRVPSDLGHRVVVLWPSELEAARRQRPELRWLPLRALGAAATAPLADLSPIQQRAFEPRSVEMDAVGLSFVSEAGVTHEVALRPRVLAYVHKYPGDTAGAVILLAFGRRVAKVSDREHVMPGVTLVAALGERGDTTPGIGELMSNLGTLRELAEHVVEAAWARRDDMIGTAMARLSGFDPAWHVPLIASEVESASPASVGLHYVEGPDSEAYLAWRSDPLLALDIGRTLEGRRCRVVDALYRARDVGGVVVGDAHRRWYTLESESREYETWVLHASGRRLLEALLSPASLWEMPIVPEALPRPKPAADQTHLLLDVDDVAHRLERIGDRPIDVVALQAHLLVARLTGAPEQGLASVRLFTRYDPRALTARSRVSLETLEQEPTWPVLAPPGAGGRWLRHTAVEVLPGIAHLLDEYRDCEMAPMPAPTRDRAEFDGPAPHRPAPTVRRPGETALATVTVADPLAVGALHVDPNADAIALWARGLQVGKFRIPSPLRAVSGRLWLTDAGVAAGHGKVLAVCIERARELFGEAEAGAALSPPGSERRAGLEAFVRGVHQAVEAGHDRIGMELGGEEHPSRQVGGLPVLRGGPDLWLGQLVRFALGRQVQFTSAWFSWRAARVADAGFPGRIELGRLDRWIRRAMASDATPDAALMGACLVVAEALDQAPDWGPLDPALERLLVATTVIAR